ncbi:Kxd1p KNAG_0F02060 [Huiozyma naganishii CBS 8797]|uniref:Biogenesis of lysosome-related organelles complex 1 subunit KXD1 n=1 Tax=Huiozyma naganishii (strain ATCC MYA-139 / BCRC 22969 / CBS 8797 / KCTC 17520 / NBRC 10181 / NCYC 3082 / Yp74L-3) TaxID=1071383 RepID=J7RMS7_HUIN7|nr:hypothetical protein KNAG_0F02060 [Kazachstania naganishii CBS 8797]CCK70873.1 hypothetical protein KNAG_0F02060 [Kazachstania naganishii CBS 8797]
MLDYLTRHPTVYHQMDSRSRDSQTPSISSQSYAILVDNAAMLQLSDSTSSNGSGSEDDNSITSGDDPDAAAVDKGHVSDEEAGDLSAHSDELLNNENIQAPASRGVFMDNGQDQDPSSTIDVSKYIFDALIQAIEPTGFSKAISLQSKTSAEINAKSLELKQLVKETQEKLRYLSVRYDRGVATSKSINESLAYSKDRIEKINAVLRTDFPIEFNQVRDKVLERTLSEEEEEEGSTPTP